MRWLILGALLGLLLLYPATLTAIAVIIAAIVSKPVIVAFALGLVIRGQLPRLRRRH